MSDKSPLWLDALKAGGALILLAVLAVGAWLLIAGLISLGTAMWNGVRDQLTTSPEEQAQYDRMAKEWETDPRNPKVVGQKCLDAGGIPNYSAWDGDVKECKGVGNQKNVNIEVNQ